jgi:DNA-binding beta-propeller fold protein YncE
LSWTDSGNQRVQVFNSAGEYLSGFGSLGSGNGQFGNPASVAIDPASHNIAVTDIGNHSRADFRTIIGFPGFLRVCGLGSGDAPVHSTRLDSDQRPCAE